MPSYSSQRADVKLNVAALKREKHLIDKEIVEEEDKLAKMAMGLKDASEFTRWQREMIQKDNIEKIEHVQKKKIEMEMSRDAAIQAQENQKKENHLFATRIKKEVHTLLQEREKAQIKKIEDNKAVIL